MGHSNIWRVALLIILVAMIVGFAKLEQLKKSPPVAESADWADDSDPEDQRGVGPTDDPVSQFLTDLVGAPALSHADTGEKPPVAFPRIAELPPLPQAFWPVPDLVTQADSSKAAIESY